MSQLEIELKELKKEVIKYVEPGAFSIGQVEYRDG